VEGTWTPERITVLGELWAAGVPTAEIGRQLGLTKNAVVGRVHRMGLPARRASAHRGKRHLGPTCLWPIGDPADADFRFCGEPAQAARPYCAEHCALAYVNRGDGGTKEIRAPVAAAVPTPAEL